MSLYITPERVAALYECLRQYPPFCSWKLPPSEEVQFRTPLRRDIQGEYIEWNPHIITVSVATVGHWETLSQALAHEMTHQAQAIAGTRGRNQHNIEWRKRAAAVCRQFGWDRRAF